MEVPRKKVRPFLPFFLHNDVEQVEAIKYIYYEVTKDNLDWNSHSMVCLKIWIIDIIAKATLIYFMSVTTALDFFQRVMAKLTSVLLGLLGREQK